MALLVLAACAGERPPPEAPTCGPSVLDATPVRSVERPDEESADHHFRGSMPEQTEFVWLNDEHHYDYAERWDWGVPGEDTLQLHLGWDWKVGCRVERCERPDGVICCYQVCREGGAWGLSWEPPDRFGCMNHAAGGRYEWFLEGLREVGVQDLDACLELVPGDPRAPAAGS